MYAWPLPSIIFPGLKAEMQSEMKRDKKRDDSQNYVSKSGDGWWYGHARLLKSMLARGMETTAELMTTNFKGSNKTGPRTCRYGSRFWQKEEVVSI